MFMYGLLNYKHEKRIEEETNKNEQEEEKQRNARNTTQ